MGVETDYDVDINKYCEYPHANTAGRASVYPPESKVSISFSGRQTPWLLVPVDLKSAEHFYVQITASNSPAGTHQDAVDTATEFLDTVYALDSSNQSPVAADFAIDELDDLLIAGNFPKCNRLLRSASPREMSDLLIVTFLGITLGAKDKLTSRPTFYARGLAAIAERRGVDGANSLLSKYR